MARPDRSVTDDALAAEDVARVRDAILASGALAENPLAGTFTSTRGFGLLFRAGERAELARRHPWSAPFLELALHDAGDDYACYLNALSIPPGGAVGRHVDGTLQEPLAAPAALPVEVAVLYLHVPAGAGGRLVLTPADEEPVEIVARPGRLVRFAGHLPHEITPLSSTATSARLSLVLERYRPSAAALAHFRPRLDAAPPVVDVAPVFAGGHKRPFASLVRGLCSRPDDGPDRQPL